MFIHLVELRDSTLTARRWLVGSAAIYFKALRERVQNIAAELIALGFTARDRLALLLPSSPEDIGLQLARGSKVRKVHFSRRAGPRRARLFATGERPVAIGADPCHVRESDWG